MNHYHQKIRLILIFLITTLLATIAYAERSRGNLSEAVEKSKDDYKGERKVADTEINDDKDNDYSWFQCLLDAIFSADNDDDGETYSDKKNTRKKKDKPEIYNRTVGASLFGGFHHSRNYSHFAGFNFLYSFAYNPKGLHSLKFGYHRFPVRKSSYLYGSVPNLSNLSLGYQWRYYFGSEYEPLNPFLALGADGKYLFWKYNNPVYSDVYDDFGNFFMTEEISRDGLLNISASIGTGLTLFQSARLNTSIGMHVGGTIYMSETMESFKNDMFFPDFFARLNLTFEFSFK